LLGIACRDEFAVPIDTGMREVANAVWACADSRLGIRMIEYLAALPGGNESLGFSVSPTGGHMARSMMLDELRILTAAVPSDASVGDYKEAILANNALGKPTFSSREKSWRHLAQLYTLDRERALFAALAQLAHAEPNGLPLLALVCAFCRDAQLRQTFEFIDRLVLGAALSRLDMEQHIEHGFPGRFSPKMKKSLAQNVNTTWTATGHLKGRVAKVRAFPTPHPAATVYAMFAGYLLGLRGETLIRSTFGRLVAPDTALIPQHLAHAASRGWIRFRHAGGVMETDFAPLIKWINREQDLAYVTH
jgi:hypothetical protein